MVEELNQEMTKQAESLLAKAKEAALLAYAPYSNFQVGAALLLADNSVVCGCNVENASYGATMCAERVAIFSACAKGKLSPDMPPQMLAVTALPCALCLQVLAEFAKPDLPIWVEGQGCFTLGELLPHSFKLQV